METVVTIKEMENIYSSEDDLSDEDCPPSFQGKLFKWTNMLHGWQERYFILRDGTLSYCKSREEVHLGCRGSIHLQNSCLRPHEVDDCRFELRVGDCIWYLRGTTVQERKTWIEVLEQHRISESGYVSSEQNLRRQNSWHSLNSSASLSIASASSFKRSHRLKEKLAEMETFKEILCRQVESLQNYFDTCSSVVRDSAHDRLEHYLNEEEQDSTTDELSNEYGNQNNQNITGPQIHAAHMTQQQINSGLSSQTGSDCSVNGAQIPMTAATISPPVVISNGQIEAANNGTIFEDARENMLENSRMSTDTSYGMLLSDDKANITISETLNEDNSVKTCNSTPTPSTSVVNCTNVSPPLSSVTDDGGDSGQETLKPNQSRGFLSRFLTFRSSSTAAAITTTTIDPINNASATTASVTNTTRIMSTNQISANTELDSEPTSSEHSGLQEQFNCLDPVLKSCYTEQYEPSSRFEDLKRIIVQHGGHAVDFKGEAYTFKATTTGILTNLSYCIELMQQREDSWRRKVDREIEKRRRLEESQKSILHELAQLQTQLSEQRNNTSSNNCSNVSSVSNVVCTSTSPESRGTNTPRIRTVSNSNKMLIVGSPDLQEGPNCTIGEEEFFDAVDAQLDEMELADDRKVSFLMHEVSKNKQNQSLKLLSDHELFEEIEKSIKQHLLFCDPTAQEHREEEGWQIVAEEGEMRIYKKELENAEGLVIDPLQIVHEVPGVTAKEFCHYFWDVRYRMDWEIAIDQPPAVLEYCSEDTVVLHQVYKRVWPTTQRDSVYWSHIRQINSDDIRGVGLEVPAQSDNMWLVLNYSTDYKAPIMDPNSSQMIRLLLDVVLICQNVVIDQNNCSDNLNVDDCDNNKGKLSRDNLVCRVLYASSINPGGWAPASVLRTVAKREYPRFIKRFSQYVIDQTKDLPVDL